MPKRSRDKQLAKLAARRQAEREAAKRRRRILVGAIAGAIVLVALIVLGSMVLAGDDPAAARSAGPNASASTAAIPTSCSSDAPKAADRPTGPFDTAPPNTIDPAKTYTATIETSCGSITVDLLAETASEAVNNFVFLAKEGFYDGLTWHRLVQGFVIQGGDPDGVGTGGPGYDIPVTATKGASFDAKGVVAFAHSAQGGNGSQFFITLAPAPSLDPPQNRFTIFGTVAKGMDVVETIGSFPTVNGPPCPSGDPCSPTQPVYIDSVTIDES